MQYHQGAMEVLVSQADPHHATYMTSSLVTVVDVHWWQFTSGFCGQLGPIEFLGDASPMFTISFESSREHSSLLLEQPVTFIGLVGHRVVRIVGAWVECKLARLHSAFDPVTVRKSGRLS